MEIDALDLFKVLLSALCGAGVLIIKNEFFKGRKTKQIDDNTDKIKMVEQRVQDHERKLFLVEKENVIQEQQILHIQKSQSELNDFMKDLNKTLGSNTQAIESLKATNQGVKDLLEALLAGNLVLNNK